MHDCTGILFGPNPLRLLPHHKQAKSGGSVGTFVARRASVRSGAAGYTVSRNFKVLGWFLTRFHRGITHSMLQPPPLAKMSVWAVVGRFFS